MPDEPTPHQTLTTVTLRSAGAVELEAQVLRPRSITAIAVIAHPHPLYGGDMHNAVVETMFRALPTLGIATLRFNFRGVGASTGAHDKGVGERADFVAALDAAAHVDERAPVFACGYSFGADVALACDHARVDRWVAVAPPLAIFTSDEFVAGRDDRPVQIVVAAHDQYNPPPILRNKTEAWRAASIDVVDGADHFFNGALGGLRDAILNLRSTLNLS